MDKDIGKEIGRSPQAGRTTPATQSNPSVSSKTGTPNAVQFISPDPDSSWRYLWTFASHKRDFGALLMVKWRAWGIGLEWYDFNWLAVFIGPLCLTFGRIEEPAKEIEAREGQDAKQA